MSKDLRASAESPAAPVELAPPFARRHVDRIDEPARALGAKRAALHLRRQQRSPARAQPTAADAAAGALCLVSPANQLGFTLRATPVGLLIERTQHQAQGAHLVQTMVFADAAAFERWCASEPIRFDDPVLYERMRRAGHDAFDRQR